MTPDGKPENLYDLCDQVCDAIAARPLNYFQSAFRAPVSCIYKSSFGCAPAEGEACGTAFCRAGWMISLLKKPKTTWTSVEIAEPAEDLLRAAGIPQTDIDDLFAGGACSGKKYGTTEYVAEGIRGMRVFMKLHEDKLRAAPVKVED